MFYGKRVNLCYSLYRLAIHPTSQIANELLEILTAQADSHVGSGSTACRVEAQSFRHQMKLKLLEVSIA